MKDSFGNLVSGVAVTFTAPSTGASANFSGALTATVSTGSNGQATSAAFTANTVADHSIVASATGASSGSFPLVNTAGAAANVVSATGTGQSAIIGNAFTSPLVATVTDSSGNPVPSVTVTFAAPSSGASAIFTGSASVLTGSSGQATSPTVTANGIAGAYSVTASVSGLSAANFSLTNSAGAATTVLGSASNPSVFGAPVTLSATVSPTAATGTVTFYDGVTDLGVASLSSGTANLNTALLASGVRSLKARYEPGGTGSYNANLSSVFTQTVNAQPAIALIAPVGYAAGTNPESVAVGDFDGDGENRISPSRTSGET